MIQTIHASVRRRTGWIRPESVAVVLVAVYWASVWLPPLVPTDGVRAVAGVSLLLFVPGALLIRVLGRDTSTAGQFVLFAVGMSAAVLALTTVAVSLALPRAGIEAPLSLRPFAGVVTVTVAVLIIAAATRDAAAWPELSIPDGPLPFLLLLCNLPTLAAVGAAVMRRTGSNAGMFLFVGAVSLVVVLSATSHVPGETYPLVVFFVALSTVLHTNLVTGHVVGNDIQLFYFVAERTLESQAWSSAAGSSAAGLPVVTAAPVAIASVAGLDLSTTFSVVYPALFALVPVGVYYVGATVFARVVGLYGALLFTFYHLSFTATPGKQLVAELFVVLLLLLYLRSGLADRVPRAVAVLLAVGLVMSHYATTYVVGLALLVATVGLALVDRVVGDLEHGLSVAYPVVLLVGATAWYGAVSPELLGTLRRLPFETAEQLETLLVSGTVPGGAGATYVAGEVAVLQTATLALYAGFTALVALGLAWAGIVGLRRARRGDTTDGIGLTALGLPLFAFLGASYVVVVGLYADRVYQMVLPVLAPFMVVGYHLVSRGVGRVHGRLRPPRALLAVLLVTLLALNSGAAFAALDTSQDATFDAEAHDSAFTEIERQGAIWLRDSAGVERTTYQPENKLEVREYDDQTPVFTDPVSYQLLRSVLPSAYYDVELVVLKNAWQPAIRFDDIDAGYVFVRQRAIASPGEFPVLPPTHLSPAEAERITAPRNVVYSSGAVRIVAVEGGPIVTPSTPPDGGANRTVSRHASPSGVEPGATPSRGRWPS